MFVCAGLKYKKVLVFSSLVLKHLIVGVGDHSKEQIQFLLGCWLT